MTCEPAIAPPLTLLDLATLFREETDDLPGDVVEAVDWTNDDSGLLFSNREITRLANEAYLETARRRPIRDEQTPAICSIVTQSGIASYAYDRRILSIHRVAYSPTGEPKEFVLRKSGHQATDIERLHWRTETGQPCHYVENTHERTLVLDRAPEVVGTLALVVDRMPVSTELRWAYRHRDTPELAEEFHFDLLHYMLYRAYRKKDSEIYDAKASAENLALYEARIGPKPSAHMERVRREERNRRRRVRPYFI